MEKNSLQLIYDATKTKLHYQFESINHLNTRLQILIGFNAIFITAIFETGNNLPIHSITFISLFLVVISTLIALLEIRPKNLKLSPFPEELRKKFLHQPSEKTQDQILANWIEDYKDNEKIMKR